MKHAGCKDFALRIKTEYKEWRRSKSKYSTFRSRETKPGRLIEWQTRDRGHTGYRPHSLCILASTEEDDIPLTGVHIVVLEEEDLVNSIFLESTELDKQPDSGS
jgi:hypothetical protein